MTTTKLITYWPSSIARSFKRWYLRRKLAHIGYTLAHIQAQRENDRHVERVLMGRQAVLKSELHSI
jgi:hypothetical protein